MAEMGAGDPRIGVTNNESSAVKHLVQPYSDAPVVQEHADGTCAFCGNAGFRRSRLRFTDLLRLVLLQLPVRCIRCGQRQPVAFAVAMQALPAKHQNMGPSPDKPGSWKEFTAGETSTLPHARPATTAAEPVAERLDDAFKPGPPAHLGVPLSSPAPAHPVYPPPVVQPVQSQSAMPDVSAPPARTPSRRSDDNSIW